MFTGIVQSVGHIQSTESRGGDQRFTVHGGNLNHRRCQLGDSIAVSGVCLTAVELAPPLFSVDLSLETLRLSALAALKPADAVNLELALTLDTPLGGHLVSGHVDGLGVVVALDRQARSTRMGIEVPPDLSRYIASKGSITLDGVSLTVNAVAGNRFEVNLIPHTLESTTLHSFSVGRRVNIEVDLVARYLERLLQRGDEAKDAPQGVTAELLARGGFGTPETR